jgi:hypothetical protein
MRRSNCQIGVSRGRRSVVRSTVLSVVHPAHLISRYRKLARLRQAAVAFHAVLPGFARRNVGDVPRLARC